jgi:hypothetical protein
MWPPTTLRRLADKLLTKASFRKKTQENAIKWWNLIGFTLRPGFNYPLDDHRLKELWKIILQDYKKPATKEIELQMWICFRRVAGGLNKGQQMQLCSEFMNALISKKEAKAEFKTRAEAYYFSEKTRTIASFELIDKSLKIRLGEILLKRVERGDGLPSDFWALGRLGARHLLYGSLAHVLPKETCESWILRLLQLKLPKDEKLAFLYGQLAGMSGYKEIDISKEVTNKILEAFAQTQNFERLNELLLHVNKWTEKEKETAFGEQLPLGLTIEF